jgi:vacuolar-type H+-ATPase subunit C/Vma6
VSAVEIALSSRARGVSTRLLTRRVLESLADAGDLSALAHGLARSGAAIEPVGDAPDIAAVELAARRTSAAHLRTLLRWQERRPGVLDAFVAAQDHRSLRALLRGAVQSAPAAARVAGLIPTPSLPERALTELARQASPAAVVALLAVLRHGDAARLAPIVAKAQPDLFAIEVALGQGCADRARAAARRGDRTLRSYVSDLVDVGNVQTALLLAGGPRDVDPATAFVAGGTTLGREAFVAAASSSSRAAAMGTLAPAVAGTRLAAAFPAVADDVPAIERTFLELTLARLAVEARLDPLGSAPLLRVLLRIEAQSRDLRALAWGAVLGTPAVMRRQQLVTPWH